MERGVVERGLAWFLAGTGEPPGELGLNLNPGLCPLSRLAWVVPWTVGLDLALNCLRCLQAPQPHARHSEPVKADLIVAGPAGGFLAAARGSWWEPSLAGVEVGPS